MSAALLIGGCGAAEPEADLRPLALAAGDSSAEPNLAVTPAGSAVLSWLEPLDDGDVLRYATLGTDGWSKPQSVASGSDWFVNWADFPSVVPITANLWAAHWLQKTPGSPYAYDVEVTISTDGGATWAESSKLHDDGTASEHGFVSLFPWQDGVGAVWLDGRETLTDDPVAAQMTLRAARLSGEGVKVSDTVVDGRVCDCCQTDATLAGDVPVVVYRDRTANEIRDIYVTRFIDGQWTEGVPVADDGWEIAGCPVNGPSVSARGTFVAVAWFTAAHDDSKVRLAFSDDGGETFKMPVDVDAGTPLGRVGVTALGGDGALVTWMRNIGGQRARILARRYAADGRAGSTVIVAETSAARRSGFPQTVLAGDTVVFAWTDATDEDTRILTSIAPVSAFEL